VSVNIKSPDAATTVPGNPLVVVVHYNTLFAFIPPWVLRQADDLAGTTYQLECLVTRLDAPGTWRQTVTVGSTGSAGADFTFNFYDTDGSPIPNGTYEIDANFWLVTSLFGGTIMLSTPFGSDSHNPVYVQTT